MTESLPRPLALLLGPELTWLAVIVFVRLLVARLDPETPAGVAILERSVWLVPLVGVGLAFLAFRVPGAGGWPLLARVVLSSLAGTSVAAAILVGGFGDGARGQDAAFIIAVSVALVLVSLLGTIAAAGIWIARSPPVAAWYRAHRVLFSAGTLAASIPVGVALGLTFAVLLGVAAGVVSAFRR